MLSIQSAKRLFKGESAERREFQIIERYIRLRESIRQRRFQGEIREC
jgi:hypothetical protein